ncbi:GNAT family N-acetyltransferase [Mesobacillus maritimus]|uniref:GNAT family N-acetyltransferase n=1 Tax=Mesobacillus maritimus TaxID=1643336 RepID=A0ABS7K3F2_9BACI|nr:GNAT family N-acetyltransferase [Mesobacillus maritimus]MBY0096676.1 GNAT family N-acetyltransferase [Mesobacillus maritimus]
MIIRDAKEQELRFIREQRLTSYEEHASRVPMEHWLALQQAISSEVDIRPGVERIVSEIDGEIVGSVVLFPANTDAYEGSIEELNYPEIRMLAVSPQVRGRGVATALVSECIQRARAKGYQSIGLHTGEFMEGAMKLYERLGFIRVPEHDFEPAGDGINVKAYRLAFD